MTSNRNRLTGICIGLAVATLAASAATAQQRPMSINEWLQAERGNANMERAVREYERARFGTASQQPQQPPAYQQPYYPPQQAQTPQAAPAQPVQPQPLIPNQPQQYQQPVYPQQQYQQPPQPYPYQAQPNGGLPQHSNQPNTYQAPPNALEKIDKEYKNRSVGYSSTATGYYVSAHLGWSFVGGSTYDFGAVEVDADMSMLSFQASSALGYKLGNGLSLEFAGTYQRSTVDELTLEIPIAGLSESTDDVNGSVSILAMMANAKYELPFGQNISPYVLGGIGPGMHFINDVQETGDSVSIDDSGLVFAYQFGAGVMVPLNSRTSLDIGYRYFGTTGADMEVSGVEFEADFSNHSLMLGLTHQL
ncbi:MAG: outer membrane protein [Rhodospirillales bacterium]